MPKAPSATIAAFEALSRLRKDYSRSFHRSDAHNQRWIESLIQMSQLHGEKETLNRVSEEIASFPKTNRASGASKDTDVSALSQKTKKDAHNDAPKGPEASTDRLERWRRKVKTGLEGMRQELKQAIEDYQTARHAEILASDWMFQQEAAYKQLAISYLLQQRSDWKASFFAVDATMLCSIYRDQSQQWQAHGELASLDVLRLPEIEHRLTEKPSPQEFHKTLESAIRKKRLKFEDAMIECRLVADPDRVDAVLIELPIETLSFPLRMADHLDHLLSCGRQRRITAKVLGFPRTTKPRKAAKKAAS
ncbi:MAG: hypothetical protein VXW84_03130 [Verrucomicrobiota bacterium]|nr:hypothetical protein [Verrucomicrobiota bacterium]